MSQKIYSDPQLCLQQDRILTITYNERFANLYTVRTMIYAFWLVN